jgi:hypothetical protein
MTREEYDWLIASVREWNWARYQDTTLERRQSQAIVELCVVEKDMVEVEPHPGALTVVLFSSSNVNNDRSLTRKLLRRHGNVIAVVPERRAAQAWPQGKDGVTTTGPVFVRQHGDQVYSDHTFSRSDFLLETTDSTYNLSDLLVGLSYDDTGRRVLYVPSTGFAATNPHVHLWFAVTNFALFADSSQTWMNSQTHYARQLSLNIRLAKREISKSTLHLFRRIALRERLCPDWLFKMIVDVELIDDVRINGRVLLTDGRWRYVAVAGHMNILSWGRIDWRRYLNTVENNFLLVYGDSTTRRRLRRQENVEAEAGLLSESGVRKQILWKKGLQKDSLWHGGLDWIFAVSAQLLWMGAIGVPIDVKAVSYTLSRFNDLRMKLGMKFVSEGFQAIGYRREQNRRG